MTEKMNKGRTKLDNKIGEGREGKWEKKMCKRYGWD